jgi:hypothetical protein
MKYPKGRHPSPQLRIAEKKLKKIGAKYLLFLQGLLREQLHGN